MLYIIEAEYTVLETSAIMYIEDGGDGLTHRINRAQLYYTDNSVEQRVSEYSEMYPNYKFRYRHVNIVIDETKED